MPWSYEIVKNGSTAQIVVYDRHGAEVDRSGDLPTDGLKLLGHIVGLINRFPVLLLKDRAQLTVLAS